jgi:immunity protein, SdpI family
MGADEELQDPQVEPSIDRRPAVIVTAVVLAIELGIAAYGFTRVPPGARVAIHWDAMGHANGYGDALWAFMLVPGLTAVISGVLLFLPAIEPRSRNLQRSGAAYMAVWISLLVLMAGVQAAVVLSALGVARSETVVRLVPAAVGVMLAVTGNYLGKVRSNFFFGIRTPWTLSSERSWNRTHRLGGRLLVAVGLTAAATSLFPWVGLAVLAIGLPAVIVIVFVYSYVQWSRDPAKIRLGRLG